MNRVILLNLVLVLVVSCPVEAVTITVKANGTGDYPTIQAAIDAAVNGDEVVAEDGTYRGVGNRDIDFLGKAITVRSENGPENCVIDCQSAGRGFYFHRGEDATSILSGFTIKGGSALLGGGIYCEDSRPTLINCEISGNTAEDAGGGIYCKWNSSPTLTHCIISGNTTEGNGGGIYIGGKSPILTNCTISGNMAEGSGGGIYCGYSSPILTSCIIAGNMAGDDAGGIYGGGLNPGLTNCTVASNTAEHHGGGILVPWDDQPHLTGCIFWGNIDESGTGQLAQIRGGRPDVMYSCIQDDDANDGDIPFSDANGNIDDRPRFVREPNDGGDGWGAGDNDDFGDLHLRVVSPCINAGQPTFVAGPNNVDMDGQPRVMGLRIDMGVDEYEKVIAVTRPAGGEVWTAGSTHEIEWSSYGARQVDILLSKNAGGNWQSIKGGVSDTGGYSWRILNKYCGEQAQVKVVPSEPDADVACIASGVFEIVPYQGPASVPRRKKEPGHKPTAKYGPEFGCVKWKFETDGPMTAGVTIGREIGRQRKVYAACEDGRLYALDLETGALIWSYDVNSPLIGSAAEGLQGSVYVGGRDGRLYAIDKNGGLLWTHSTDAPMYSAPVVSPQEQIYVCSEDGTLYALRRNGSEVWRYETSGFAKLDGSIFATPQIGSDGTVYIAGLYDPNLYALNPKDGSVKWTCNLEHTIEVMEPEGWHCESQDVNVTGWPFAPPVIAEDGTIYMSLLFDTYLFAIEPEGGSINWLTNLSGLKLWYRRDLYIMWYGGGDPPEEVEDCKYSCRWFDVYCISPYLHAYCWSKPALGPDGTIYVSFDDPYLRAVDPNGSKKWFTKLGELGGFTLSVGDDGLIYAANDDNNLYVVNPDGEEVARFEGDGWLSHPVIAPGHTIIVSDANNTVWAITQEDCGDKPIVLDAPPEPNEPNEP
ncbi:MAG: outer membrane protein assembly factor BamB family protein [Planctomycetota bacterium]|jgi:parallel beta-helix repeat protein